MRSRKRKRENGSGRDDRDRDDDVVEAGMPTRMKKPKHRRGNETVRPSKGCDKYIKE